MVLRPFRSLRAILLAALALSLGGCLRFEIEGRVYADGVFRAIARTRLPVRVAHDPVIGPILRGVGPRLESTWTSAGLRVAEIPGESGHFELRGDGVEALALPWLQPSFRRTDSAWTYSHAISFPPEILARLEASIAEGLSRMDKHSHGANEDARVAARLFAELATIKLRWRFPGTVRETNGTRIDDETIEWSLTAGDLRAGGDFPGWATGTTSLWRRVVDPLLRWLDERG